MIIQKNLFCTRNMKTSRREKSENQVNWQILSVAFEPLQRLVVTVQAPQIWNELQEVGTLLPLLPSCQGDLKFSLLLSHCIMFLHLHEVFNLLQVGYCSCGWRLSTLSPVLEARTTPSTCSFTLFSLKVQLRKLPSGAWSLASSSSVSTIYSTPQKWKMIQVLYIGGSKVSLPDSLSKFAEKFHSVGAVGTLLAARSKLIESLPNQPGFQKIPKSSKT